MRSKSKSIMNLSNMEVTRRKRYETETAYHEDTGDSSAFPMSKSRSVYDIPHSSQHGDRFEPCTYLKSKDSKKKVSSLNTAMKDIGDSLKNLVRVENFKHEKHEKYSDKSSTESNNTNCDKKVEKDSKNALKKSEAFIDGTNTNTVRDVSKNFKVLKPEKRPAPSAPSAEENGVRLEPAVKVVLFAVLSLFVVNTLLFYKLWYLDSKLNLLNSPRDGSELFFEGWEDLNLAGKLPKTTQDWITIFEKQENLHRKQIKVWNEVLATSIALLKQTEETLTRIKEEMQPHQFNSFSQYLVFLKNSASSNSKSSMDNHDKTEAKDAVGESFR